MERKTDETVAGMLASSLANSFYFYCAVLYCAKPVSVLLLGFFKCHCLLRISVVFFRSCSLQGLISVCIFLRSWYPDLVSQAASTGAEGSYAIQLAPHCGHTSSSTSFTIFHLSQNYLLPFNCRGISDSCDSGPTNSAEIWIPLLRV